MVTTPWGEVQALAELAEADSSNGRSPEFASRPPRERLQAAMIGACAERGFEALTVTDLLSISGVSRATFYEHFDNKEDCFMSTLDTVLKVAVALIAERYGSDATPQTQAREAFAAFTDLVRSRPETAKLCLVEPFVVGGPAIDALAAALEKLRVLAEEALTQAPGSERLPRDLSRAILGGIHQVFFHRLRDGSPLDGIEDPLWEWAVSYRVPPQPLRLRGRRPKPPPAGSAPPFAFCDPAERIIRGFAAAAAEKGYRHTTISDIAAHASISQRTFYEYFENKEELLTAALDSSGMQLAAAVLPAIRRAAGWPEAVRAGAGATMRYYLAEPDFARLRQVEVYAAGPEAIAQRDRVGTEIFGEAITPDGVPEVDPIAAEAIVGAVYSLQLDLIRGKGVEVLPEFAPLVTYVTLAPMLGPERACEVANGDGR